MELPFGVAKVASKLMKSSFAIVRRHFPVDLKSLAMISLKTLAG